MSIGFFLCDDWLASANLGFEFFEPSPFPERDHDDKLLAISLNHKRPVGCGDVRQHQIAKQNLAICVARRHCGRTIVLTLLDFESWRPC